MVFAELLFYNWEGNWNTTFSEQVSLEFLLFSATEMDLREFRQCLAISRWFPEALGSRRVALGQWDPWKSLLCFSLPLDRRGSRQAQLHGNTGLGQFKKSYLDLTMGCQTPVLCGILSVKAIHLGPWDAYVISISIKKWLTKPHNVSHLEGE